MIYESPSNQYNSIGSTIRTNSNKKPSENNNIVSTDTSPETGIKHNYTPKGNNYQSNTIIPMPDNEKGKGEDKFVNVACLYEQNNNRIIRRNNQIRRIQSKMPFDDMKFDKEADHSNYLKNDSLNFFNSTGTLKTYNESPSIIITERVTTEGQTNRVAPIQFIIEDNNLNESDHMAPSSNCNDAEINVSDLDCDINKNDDSESTKSLCLSTSRSFVSLANNLIIKKDAKEDNSTSSYLLALNQSENPFTDSNNINEENDNVPKDYRHVRLPSGKNFFISSVIEEEKSELFTDSDISNQKLSFLLSTKQKLERALGRSDSDFKLSKGNVCDVSLSKDFIKSSVDKNLDKLFFFNIHKKGINNNILNECKLMDELSDYATKEDIQTIQNKLKRAYNEIVKECDSKEETRKNKIESKKKAVLDLFLNYSNHKGHLPSVNEYSIKYDNNHTPNISGKKRRYNDINKINFNISLDSEQKPYEGVLFSEERETYEELHDKYKECRQKKKSSIFKSEDLKVSKTDDVYLDTSKLVSPMSKEKTDNLFISSKSDLKNEFQLQDDYETDKLNEIKQQLFSVNHVKQFITPYTGNQVNKLKHKISYNVNDALSISKEINFDMCSSYHQQQQERRNISMEITQIAHLQFEGIPNNKAIHLKNNSHVPSSKLSQTNHRKDNDSTKVDKILTGFSSMLTKLKYQNLNSSSLGKERPWSNIKERKISNVSYPRFNTSSRDKNIFNKQSNRINDANKSKNMPSFSKPFLNNNNKCPNVTVLEVKKLNNTLPPNKLFKPTIAKKSSEDQRDTPGNKRSILNTLNYISFYRDGEKNDAIKCVKQSKCNYFALYLKEEENIHYFIGIYEIYQDKGYLHKITSGNKYPIPVKINYSNIIDCFSIDESFKFEPRGRIIIGKEVICFLQNSLKF